MTISKEVSENILLKGVFDGLDDFIQVLDLDAMIVESNDNDSADKGKNWFETWPQSHREKLEESFQKVLAGEKLELKLKKCSERGNFRWWRVKLSFVKNDYNQITHILVISRDITDESRAKQELIDSKLRLSLATDAGDIGIWDWDISTGSMVFSETQLKILGLDKDKELISIEDFYSYIHVEDREEVNFSIEKSLKSGDKYSSTFRFLKECGRVIWLKGIGQVVKDSEGENSHLIGIHVDITSQRETLNALKQAKYDANSAFRAKSDFVTNISHEIRTPMNSILGYTDLLTRKNVSDHLRLDFANQIQKSGKHLLNLLNDVLDISKIEAGRLSIDNKEVDLSVVVCEIIKSLSVVALRKGIKLNLELLSHMPRVVFSDDLRIRQILINLIGNAIKFTKLGKVDVKINFESDSDRFGQFEISIIDTGIGMDKDSSGKLFDPFTQSDESISRKFGGTGLGLHLSKKLAHHLSGDITLVDAELNKGCHFSFKFPVTYSNDVELIDKLVLDVQEELEFSEQYAISSKKLKILLVEDSVENQRLIKIFLSGIDVEIDIAENGQEGIQYALSKEYDLVFMDIMMPVLDGLSATKKLRESGYSKPIVALTAHAIRQEVENCLNAGCNAHLAKPVSQNELLRTVEMYSV